MVVRKRLIFWLIKAYIKKSKKILILSFLAGLLVFFAILFGAKYLKALITLHRFPVIGVVGSYEKNNLPPFIENKLSKGLTRIEPDDTIKLDLAKKYTITDKGKTYIFDLDPKISFSDGGAFTSSDIKYNFSDVKIEKPEKQKIVFRLKTPYAPFLSTVSGPVFKKGLTGVGPYFIKNIDLNGNFVQSITLGRAENRFETLKYVFYPTESALKTAFMLGEITEAQMLTGTSFKKMSFSDFPKTKVKKTTDYSHLIALFYNNSDTVLSDKKLRLSLNYALPDNLKQGEKATFAYSPKSIYFNKDLEPRKQDLEHSKLLLPQSSKNLKLTTIRKYKHIAEEIASAWKKLGIKTEIIETDTVPDRFQIFLSDFTIPKDPDQYQLWHSNQPNNITKFKDLRIDKLLEDGRKTTNITERKKIYADFQRFLLDGMPASFLYFPYEYTVTRE